MKNIHTYIFFVLLLLVCSSCSDFLDKEPDSELTLEMVFQDKTRLESWLANVYSGIPDPTYPYAKDIGWEVLGDDMTPSERWRQWGWYLIPAILGEWNTSTPWKGDYWAKFPRLIRSAYIFIENAHPLPEQDISAKEVENMKVECRFLAAYYYYLLVNTYGPIPFKPNYIAPTDASLAELMTGQVPYDTIIDWLDKEFKEVAKLLPATYTDSSKYGRATSIMALAVRARMLLFAASPLVNGNPDYKGHVNCDNEELFNSNYEHDKWKKAVDANKELIELAHANGAKLYYEYNKDGSIDPFTSYQNMMLTRWIDGNKEILFARPVNDGKTYDRYCIASGSKGTGGYGVTQSLVDAFFMKNGLPIDDNHSGYVEKGFSTEDIKYETDWEGRKNGVITTKGTYNMYCNREPRFYVSVNYSNAYSKLDNRYLDFRYKKTDNNGTHDAPQNGYLARKKVHPDSNPIKKYYPYRPGILYRLGEVYLNYAEALNEYKDEESSRKEALSYVNKIRVRAGVREYTFAAVGDDDENFIQVENTQTALRKAIRLERRVELCCEGIRYDDLRRWKEAEHELNREFYGMNFYGTENSDDENNEKAFFKRTVYQKRVYNKEYYWFPVHQTEMDKNPKLEQAPFWK